MRNVAVGGNFVFDTVARPHGRRTPHRQQSATAEGTRHHEFGTGLIIIGLGDSLGRIANDGSKHRLTHAVGNVVAFGDEILLKSVRHDVRSPRRRL